jgi:hypothetical protein
MKALILENKVIQLAAEEFEVAPPLIWVDCGDEVKDNWDYIDGVFSDPITDEERFKALKESKLAENNTKFNEYMYADVPYKDTTFSSSEKVSNNLQAADKYGTFPLNWIDTNYAEIEFNRGDVLELMRLIMVRRNAGYSQRATYSRQINAATTIDGLNAIDISYTE